MSSPLNVHLEQYEGPLDLLLDLIRKQQIDIHDIPIATITAAVSGVHGEGARDGHGAGRRVRLHGGDADPHQVAHAAAARPRAGRRRRPAKRIPARNWCDRLLEHERFKNAAEMLQQKRMIEENVWSNPQMKAFIAEDDDPGLAVTLFDLVKAFGEVLERAKNRPVYEVNRRGRHRARHDPHT